MQSIVTLPPDWRVLSIKRLINPSRYYQIGDGDHGSIKPDMYQDEGVPYIRVQNLSWNGNISLKDIVRIPEKVHLENKKSRLVNDDLLIAKTGATIGKVGYLSSNIGEANTTSSVGKITVDQTRFIPKYILYCLISSDFQRQLWLDATMKSAQPGFNIEQLVNYKVYVPALEAQQKIANFLDAETAKIDNLIARQERLLQLLEEKRRATITHAVTRGLDSSVELKETNNPWLGKIPTHWTKASLKMIFSINAGGDLNTTRFSEVKTEEYMFPIYTNDITSGKPYGYTNRPRYTANSITVTGRGDIGKARYRDHKFDAIIRLLVLKPLSDTSCLYYTNVINEVLNFSSNSAAIGQLSTQQLGPSIVPIPPVKEQHEIAGYLIRAGDKTTALVQKIQTQITLLRERRTSLISHAVTGKIKI